MSTAIKKKTIMDADAMRRALVRVAHEIVEKNKGVENIILVGIRTRGVPLAQRIAEEIKTIENIILPVGTLDITLYKVISKVPTGKIIFSMVLISSAIL